MANYEPYMVVEIAGKSYTLSGEIIEVGKEHYVVVSYHKPFEKAEKLGSIDEIIGQVDDVLKLGNNLKKEWDAASDAIGNIPLLGEVSTAILRAPIRITDIGINTQSKEYSFGFALDFTTEKTRDIIVAGITLQAFGFVVKTTKE